MKRSIKLLLCTLAVLLAVPLAMCAAEKLGFDSFAIVSKAEAATIVDSGECGDDGDNVTWTLDSDGLLTISGTGSMCEYSYQNAYGGIVTTAPWGQKQLTSVVISNGITSIGKYAFCGCRSITSITILDGVTSIGYEAFRGCTGLTNITIPDSVTSIGDCVFYDCRSLTSITIPDSVTSIGDWAFCGCIGLTSITIPDSVTSIGAYAFSDVPNIVYSGNLSGAPWGARALNGYIEDGIVYEDSSKTKLLACLSSREGTFAIPDSVTSIGDSAFSDCSSLTRITIPNSVTSIGVSAF